MRYLLTRETVLESRTTDQVVIKPTGVLDNAWGTSTDDARWYDCWVRHQMELQPRMLYSVLSGTEPQSLDVAAIATIWRQVWIQASTTNASIDSIVTRLLEDKLIMVNDDVETLSCARNLVFAIIGWQTLLYKPDPGSCPPTQFAVTDECDGHRGLAFMDLRQDQYASSKPLHEFLMGFGVLLPCPNFNALASDDKRSLAKIKALSSDSFNAHLLANVGGVHVKWTDSLACHLEFDSDSNSLYLFRFPTFCAIILRARQNDTKSTLHSCAAPPIAASHWATHEGVNVLLKETLLSYRLLFGQNKASRRLFRSLDPFEDVPEGCTDSNLSELGGRKQTRFGDLIRELESYSLHKDFPILRYKLAMLAQHFSNRRPRTWKELWNDKRDSASWFTFWAVLVIGGIGIFLAFVQVVLQIVQVSLQVKGS
ncbi:hypothetical protein K458DRAFT_316608 [Lentithecium fluviatile CBS 122367]|uniref:Uncharacterized protein n=1 Tax=Lentithecium fluviatile CBS 122367 TaxID=1168545 RepID=A0A6G1IJX7_9PLEO|nr:hypothetical protein K458DRAFT_316608 [Lentithecium fluviatile CBS 122367]